MIDIIKSVGQSTYKFYAIGKIKCRVSKLNKHGINYIKGSEKNISNSEYIENIKSLDIVLFIWSSDSYRFTASGALLDALSLSKNIIYIRNNYTDYISKLWEFGIPVENINEIISVLNDHKNLSHEFDKIKLMNLN